jgi:outer membrane protein assembly factor BamB
MTDSTRGPYRCRWLLALLLLSCSSVAVGAANWLQFGGPTRDFKVDVAGLATSWPKAGPRKLWSRELGEGYSSIAVDGNRLYTMYRAGEREIVVSLDAQTGKTLWEYPYEAPRLTDIPGKPADYNLEAEPGPHAMPLIVGNLVFTVGASGKLHCLDKNTGKLVWGHDLHVEFLAPVKKRGYAISPFPYKNTIIVPAGAQGASIVAFNQSDGAVVWKKHDFELAYSFPTLISVDGQTQLVVFAVDWIVGLNPDNGELYWQHPAESSNGTHVSMPVWGEGNLLFYSAAYGLGGHVLRLTRAGEKTVVRELWHNPRLRLHYSNAIRLGDVIYASTGDFGPAFFTAFEAQTGKILWQDRSIARTSFLYADGRFIILDEDGNLVLASPSAKGLTIHATAAILEEDARTVPTLVGKTLYVRDRKMMMALDLSSTTQ